MVEARKAHAVGFNHVALEVGEIEEALAFYGRLFDFKLRGQEWHFGLSSIWAINSSHCRKAELKPLTRDVILGLWSTTRMPSARRWPKRGSNRCPARFSRFSTPGAIA
jgi:catechol 2,3-dioxygenase-like lactoylglutathione lyase family enzyme